MDKDWTIAKRWNEILQTSQRDPNPTPRNHLWASELGGSMIDIYLKLHGVAFSNAPNERAERKFEAGRYFENLIKGMFKRAGIFKAAQEHLKFQYPGLLEVTGYNDLRVGGQVNVDQATEAVTKMAEDELITPKMIEITRQVAQDLSSSTLMEKHIEVKSCSSFMFEKYEQTHKPSPLHALQLYHYLKAKPLAGGSIFYVCRDDLRLLEFPLLPNDSVYEQMYYEFIRQMTEYWKKGEQPPLEQTIYFDFDDNKFHTNWKVQYSPYITKLYGFENEGQYFDLVSPQAARYNRVITRIINSQITQYDPAGQPVLDRKGQAKKVCTLTKYNLEVIEEMGKQFANWDVIEEHLSAQAQMLEAEKLQATEGSQDEL